MGTIPAKDVLSGSLAPFVTAEQKAELAKKVIAFGIVGAIPKRTSQYGEETVFKVSGQFFDNEVHLLSLSHSDYRESQAQGILDALALQPGATVGPVWIESVKTSNGKSAWNLTSEKPSAGSEAAGSDAGAATAPSFVGDDDIPF